MTDKDRQSVYSAEYRLRKMLDSAYDAPTVVFRGSTLTMPHERKFASIESVQRYLDTVLGLNWVAKKWERAKVPVTVKEKKASSNAHYERLNNRIVIPAYEGNEAWAMRELVVLHELAHHLDTGTGHGPSFTETFVELVAEIIGPEAGFILRALFYDEGLQVG